MLAAALRLPLWRRHGLRCAAYYGLSRQCCRSFALVIQQLPNKPTRLRDAVCVFYLVLRALDTVEDDMALSVETKLPILKAFHEHIDDRCALPGCLLRVGYKAW